MPESANNLITKLRDENQSLRTQVKDFERLGKVIQSVCSTLQVDQLLEHLITEAIALCQASQGSIILFNPESKKM